MILYRKELFNFIWKGNDKIKWLALINDIEYAGLKMMDLHVESMIQAPRVMCLKKYIEDYIPVLGKFSRVTICKK